MRLTRPAALLATLATLATAAAGLTIAAAPASARAARGGGNVLENSGIIGETPAPQVIYLNRHATKASTVSRMLAADAKELHRLGFNIRYAGYGTPKAAEGRIRVTSGGAGCVGDGGQSGAVTYPRWQYLPGGKAYMYDARVIMCPAFFTRYPSWELAALLKHELGHALGLDHENSKYDGKYQMMRWTVTPGITDYQAGDLNGLRWLARNASLVKSLVAPVGRFERASWSRQGNQWDLHVTGWAVLANYPTAQVKITVTRDGQVLATAPTRVLRRDVNKARKVTGDHGFSLTPGVLAKGTHSYCVTATSPVNKAAKANFGCTKITV